MATGLQREGLKAQEVFKIRSTLERLIADGEDRDIAYALACREVVGVDGDTFKRWKPDIFKLLDGKPTAANSMLSGALEPAQSKPANSAVYKRVEQLGSELDAVKNDHTRLLEENEKLKAQLAANVLGEDPKTPAPAVNPEKKTK